MQTIRKSGLLIGAFVAIGLAASAPIAVSAQDAPAAISASATTEVPPAVSPASRSTAPAAGPRLAPRWEPRFDPITGELREREVNRAARANTITIPVVTLLLGIIILILLVD